MPGGDGGLVGEGAGEGYGFRLCRLPSFPSPLHQHIPSEEELLWAALRAPLCICTTAESTSGRGYRWQRDLGELYSRARGVASVHNVLAGSVTPAAAGNRAHQAPIPRWVGSRGASWRVQRIYTCSRRRCGKANPGSRTPAVIVVTRWSRTLTHCFNLIFIV